MDKANAKRAFADAIVMQLWMRGLISNEERDRILSKNKSTFIL